LIAARREDRAGDYSREAEALFCGLVGIAHPLLGAPDVAWIFVIHNF